MLFICLVGIIHLSWHRVTGMRCDYVDYVLCFAHSSATVETVVRTVLPEWVLGWVFLSYHDLWWTTRLLLVYFLVRDTSALWPTLYRMAVLLEQLLRWLSPEGTFRVLKSIGVALNKLVSSLGHQNFVLSSWCCDNIDWRAIKGRRVVYEDILLLHALDINSLWTLLLHRDGEFWTKLFRYKLLILFDRGGATISHYLTKLRGLNL